MEENNTLDRPLLTNDDSENMIVSLTASAGENTSNVKG
jgi:cation-transporting ATPase 13A2